jgi:fermentation-respiration switch protein FrsA (DUF1100 family)
MNGDPERAPALIAALPEALRRTLSALDLKGRDLSRTPPHVLLVHGRDDAIIPASESIGLAATLPAGRARLYLVDSLSHADLGPGGWRDLVVLWRATYRLLALRDGAE